MCEEQCKARYNGRWNDKQEECSYDLYLSNLCYRVNFNENNTTLLAALKLAIMHVPTPSHIHPLCNALYFSCCVIKVLYNLRQVASHAPSHV